MSWQSETVHEKLTRLRAQLDEAQEALIDAETALADRMIDIRTFEAEFEARTGYLLGHLADLEAEVDEYLDRIKQRRNRDVFGTDYRSADEQYRRTWQRPVKPAAPPPPPPPDQTTKVQIKKLYRQLARHFHPDLAAHDADRAYRTEKMSAINDAYAARSLTELLLFAAELETAVPETPPTHGQTEADMIKALEAEIQRCRRRLQEIELEMKTLHNHPSVELALEVRLAQRQGRDLLGEITSDLEKNIARKTAERDMIKSQFDSLKPDNEIKR